MSRETAGGQESENSSWYSEYFEFQQHGTDLRTELIAGLTTFMTMSYTVIVIPSLLTGIPNEKAGIMIPGYTPMEIRQMLTVTTILAAIVGTAVMALYAKRPFAVAPSLGLTAYVVYTVMGALGVPWETAMAAVFTEGVIFLLLTVFGVRKFIIHLFPKPVKLSVGVGIGLFLAVMGLREMHLVVSDPNTLVTLGDVATDPIALLSVLGLFLTFVLYAYGTPASILIGIVSTAFLAWSATLLGLVESGTLVSTDLASVNYDVTPLLGAFIDGFQNVEPFSFSVIVFTLFFVNFFDTAGTLIGVGQVAGFLDDDGNMPEIEKPLMADAFGTTLSGILGNTSVATYVESAAGVEEGGRTGMTALIACGLFGCTLVIVPLTAAVPRFASNIALVLVALIMLQNVTEVDWDDVTHAIPAGMTILIMPLTASIAYGVAAGIISYPIVKFGAGEWRQVRTGHVALALIFTFYIFVRTSGLVTSTM